MGKQNSIQTSWTKGEISPLARGRVDVNLYANGAETIENLIVRPQGPLFRRSGTKFVTSTKVPTESAILIPFEVSDEQAYILELGKGYIHMFKDKSPLLETTNLEVEAFRLSDNGGLMQLYAEDMTTAPGVGTDYGDLPTVPIISVMRVTLPDTGCWASTSHPHGFKVGSKVLIAGAASDRLSAAITNVANAGGLFEITTAADRLVTGDVIGIYGSTNYPTINNIWTVTRTGAGVYTLNSSTFAGAGASDASFAYQVTVTDIAPTAFKFDSPSNAEGLGGYAASHGLIAGDKFYVSGATDYPQLSERYLIVKSVETAHKWTIANVDFDNSSGNPAGEEAHTLPIEIQTPYGYGPAVPVSGTNGTSLATDSPHGFTVGDMIIIEGTSAAAIGGRWEVLSTPAANSFTINNGGVSYGILSFTAVTARRELAAADFSIKDIKFAQSADVLYITHPLYPPMKLVRTDVDGDRNDWLFAEVAFNDGPYLGLNDLSPSINESDPSDGAVYPNVYFEVSGYSHTATVKAAAAFINADDNLYIEWKEGDQWQLGQLGTLAGGETSVTVTVVDNIMSFLDETTTLKSNYRPGSDVSTGVVYKAAGANGKFSKAGYYSNNGAVYLGKVDPNNELSSNNAKGAGVGSPTHGVGAGTITSQYSNTFASADVGKYVRIKDDSRTARAHWVQITALQNGSGGTSNKASHSASVAMASNNATGKFVVSSRSRTATITAKKDGAAFAAFAATDIGRPIRLGWAGRWAWGKITGYTSTSVVTVTLYTSLPRDTTDASKIAGNQDSIDPATGNLSSNPTTGITYDWRLGAWSDTTGFPAHVVFHEQRLAFAATTTEPQTFWMSVSADFENFMPTELDSTVLDDNAITYTLASAKANPIRWLVSGSSLGVGTSGGEWRVYAATGQNDPITPSSITAKENTTHGSLSRVAPAKTGSSIMFVDRSTWKVQELFYSYELDSMDSDELTVIGEHILREHDGAVCAAFQQKPHSIYWIVCADGTLSAMTFNKKQEVVAWHHHTIEGATVEWVTTIPSADGTEDELWMICKRTINGSDYRTVEVMESDYYPSSSSSRSGMKFQDSHIIIPSGDPYFTGTTITGLNWLIGKTVMITGDGVKVGTTHTVNASGEITTLGANAYSEIVIGPNGNADLGSLPPEGGSNFGTSQGQTKRLVSLDVRFLNTSNVSFGPNTSNLTDKTLYSGSFSWFTGTERLLPKHGYDKESKYYIRQADPYPLNILFVVAKLDTNE